jgi:hypothetical protein
VRELPEKYNFKGNGDQKAVTVDSKGNHKTESDFEKEGKGWWDHPDEYRWKSEDYKNKEGKGWWDHPDEYRWKSEDYKNRRI